MALNVRYSIRDINNLLNAKLGEILIVYLSFMKVRKMEREVG